MLRSFYAYYKPHEAKTLYPYNSFDGYGFSIWGLRTCRHAACSLGLQQMGLAKDPNQSKYSTGSSGVRAAALSGTTSPKPALDVELLLASGET